MPKIRAATIAEHVQQQEAAILAAAERLFVERGVAATDLQDIAAAVGLARSSLYRYFPDKDHILLRWFEREMRPVIEGSGRIASGDRPASERLTAWLDFQLDYLDDRDHQLAPRLMQEIGAVSAEVRQALGVGHRDLYSTVEQLVAELVEGQLDDEGRPRDPSLVVGMLVGLLQAATQAVLAGRGIDRVRPELHRAARSIVEPAP